MYMGLKLHILFSQCTTTYNKKRMFCLGMEGIILYLSMFLSFNHVV